MYQERFTKKAENVIAFAERAAKEMGHSYVGSEHLLIGLLRERRGLAAAILEKAGVSEAKALHKIEQIVGIGMPDSSLLQGLTSRSKRIIEHAYGISENLGSRGIDTEHLLLGMLREGDNVGTSILRDFGIQPQVAYGKIVQQLTILSAQGASEFPAREEFRADKNPKTKNLNQHSKDLTMYASIGKLDPVIGRDEEIERLIQVLSRRTKNNPVLIGEPGVGKTAVVEGLAQRMADGDMPEHLQGKRLLCLDLASMIAGTKYRGEFEERVKGVLQELSHSPDVVVFIDEIHMIVGAGAADGAVDAANLLKPALSRGEIQLIGATTLDEYRKHIEKDAALERRLQPVLVEEPSKQNAILMIHGLRARYEAHHGIQISDEAIAAAVELSSRYIGDRSLPDKAIDLVDEASALARLREGSGHAPGELPKEGGRPPATPVREEGHSLGRELLYSAFHRGSAGLCEGGLAPGSVYELSRSDIEEMVSIRTGIPVQKIAKEEAERLMDLEQTIHRRIVGQEAAVKALCKGIRRSRVGLGDPKRPIGTFLFLGPMGVGKTELCRALAEVLFDDEDAMVRVDMSEMMEKHSASKLIGSPPGYIGYEEGGRLTERVRRKPYCVVLLDEIEKAHPDVFHLLLQVLEDGILTDSHGKRVEFKNTVIIMTSNIGAKKITSKQPGLGFGGGVGREQTVASIQKQVMEEVKKQLQPEFINRIDEILVFEPLTKEQMACIAEGMLGRLRQRLADGGISLSWDKAAVQRLVDKGFDAAYGARPLRRAIQRHAEDLIAENMLKGLVRRGEDILLTVENERFCLKVMVAAV